jgi:toxin ParE1/3/4
MPLEARLDPQAERDVFDITTWMAVESMMRADKFAVAIGKALDRLGVFPEMGRAAPDLGDDRRIWLVWDYLLIYRVTSDEVIIERILHGARDLDALFDEDDDA